MKRKRIIGLSVVSVLLLLLTLAAGSFLKHSFPELAGYCMEQLLENNYGTMGHSRKKRAMSDGVILMMLQYDNPLFSYLAGANRETTQLVQEEEHQVLQASGSGTWTVGGTETGSVEREQYFEESLGGSEGQKLLEENTKLVDKLYETKGYDYLIRQFYIVDSATSISESVFPVEKLLNMDMTLKQTEEPQILVYHTHGSETFADSREGVTEDTTIGLGDVLTEELERYGWNVIHSRAVYDTKNGVLDRSKAYNYALDGIEQILKENPSIEVIIDVHRDGVTGTEKRLTTINGEKTAKIMFFNGLSRNSNGPITYLKNKNRTGNLAFSLQMECQALKTYPDFVNRIYLKNYRYNLHLRQRSLLVEVGNQNNTVSEGKNAMRHLAVLLNEVLQ